MLQPTVSVLSVKSLRSMQNSNSSGKQGWPKKNHQLTPWAHETELYYLAVLFQVWRSSCTNYKEIFELAMLVSSPHVGTPSWTGFLWEIWVLSKECPGNHRTPTCTGFLFSTIYRQKCEWISAKLTLYYLTYDKLLSFASEVVFWAILKDFEFAVYCTCKREKWDLLIESARRYHFPHPCQPNMAQLE